MRKKRDDDLKMMFLAFAGGFVLGRTGILEDPLLNKKIAEAIHAMLLKKDVNP